MIMLLFQRFLLSFLFLNVIIIIHQCSSFVVIPSSSSSSSRRATATATATTATTRFGSEKNGSNEAAAVTTPITNTGNDNNNIPANLRRKIRAPRPTIGHVVGKNGIRRPTTTTTTGGSAEYPLPLYTQGRKIYQQESNTKQQQQQQQQRTDSHRQSQRLLQIVAGSAKGRKLDSPSVYLRPMMAKVREAVFSTLTSFGLYDTTTITAVSKRRPSSSSSSTTLSSSTSTLRHLDLFAGSGSVGLESLSRGAGHVTFVDLSSDCCNTIHRNAIHCQFISDNNNNNHCVSIICVDAIKFLQNDYYPQQSQQTSTSSNTLLSSSSLTTTPLPYNLVTICPPYEEIVYADLLEAVVNSPLVTDDTVVLIEYPIELGSLPHVISSSLPLPSLSSTSSTTSTSTALALPCRRTMIGVRNRKYGRTVIAMYVVNPSGGSSSNSGGSFRLDPDAAASRPEEFV